MERNIYKIGKELFITSDKEIKDGDWICRTNSPQLVKVKGDWNNTLDLGYKKIILTDNKDLIKDGIQSIDDDFLEWFVKNPSCEYVEVKLIKDSEDHHELEGGYREDWEYYDVIIPKEEPKQNKTCILCDGTGETTFSGTYNSQRKCDVCNGKGYIGLDIIKQAEDDLQLIKSLQETKEETLEEASHNYFLRGQLGFEKSADTERAFLRGAKWQQERSYSEEDMRKCWDASKRFERPISEGYAPNFNEFIEQFKKK